jgi:hypothetical protein
VKYSPPDLTFVSGGLREASERGYLLPKRTKAIIPKAVLRNEKINKGCVRETLATRRKEQDSYPTQIRVARD